MGANDPRYARIGREIAGAYVAGTPVFSNSEHIIDIQAQIPSMAAHRISEIPPGALLMRVNLPSFDAIAPVVWPLETPPKDWLVIARWPDATLYRKPVATPRTESHLAPFSPVE